MTPRACIAGLCALLLLVGACASGSVFRTDPFDDPGPAHVEVQNNHRLDMRVFVVRYQQERRLGTVTSHTRERFELPDSWVENRVPLGIAVEAIGDEATDWESDTYVLERGSVMEVTIQNEIRYSSLSIR